MTVAHDRTRSGRGSDAAAVAVAAPILSAMANPAKRKVGGTEGTEGAEDAATSGGGGSAAKRTSTTSKRVTPPKAKAGAEATGRYTAPTSRAKKGPSPRWVPVLMFALWGVGLLLIILNYMELLPGSDPDGNGWYLVAGLGSILGGIMVATQYR